MGREGIFLSTAVVALFQMLVHSQYIYCDKCLFQILTPLPLFYRTSVSTMQTTTSSTGLSRRLGILARNNYDTNSVGRRSVIVHVVPFAKKARLDFPNQFLRAVFRFTILSHIILVGFHFDTPCFPSGRRFPPVQYY